MKYGWEEKIYRTVESLGGEADLQDIFKKLKDSKELTEEHLRPTKWGGRAAYEHTVRKYCSNMCRPGAGILFCRTAIGRYKIVKYVVRE